jgi:hypothetical protein
MAYQGHISTNPDRNRFAYAASYSDIIHFYEIAKADIRLIKKIENTFPEYTVEEKNGGVGAPIQSSNKNGYICVYSTNRYVYLLYSGRTWRDYQGEIFEADLLKIYDWKGNLQNTLQLDVPCRFFCVNPDDKKMWAITYNPDPSIVLFDLPDIVHSE